MKEVGLFFKSWLIKDNSGKYVTGFSYSPENMPPNGFGNNIHCTMDTAVVREVTSNLLKAGKILNIDQAYWPVWQDLHDNVLPYPVSCNGELKEWPIPFEEQPAHRHFSHLYPLFPGTEFTRESTPELFDAACKALQLRETVGERGLIFWSYPYIACFHARMGEGDKALKNLHKLAGKCSEKNLLPYHNYYYRLFQIEALFGAVAATAEMLVQSHEGFIRLLPALPEQWLSGHYRGLKARGAFEIDCSWMDGKLTEAVIKSHRGGVCKLRNSRPWKSLKIFCGEMETAYEIDEKTRTVSFPTQPENVFKLIFE
jgi:alpha-L-fucosidase 2